MLDFWKGPLSNALNEDTVDYAIEDAKIRLSYENETCHLQIEKNSVNALLKWFEKTNIPFSKALTSLSVNSIEEMVLISCIEIERIASIWLDEEFSYYCDKPEAIISTLVDWLEKNMNEPYCLFGGRVYFKTEEDALLYKLTWL